MRRIAVVLIAVVAVLPLPASRANPVTQDSCPGSASVTVWQQLGNDVLENLLFADGSVWISDGARVRRFAADKTEQQGLTTVISSAGGLAQGTDGWIYAGSGNSIGNAVGRTGAASVLRFDPAAPNATVQTYASGFNMPNGMTFGPGGRLYFSNDFDEGLGSIPAGGGSWSLLSDVWGTNGLVIAPDGEHLYAAITFDQRSPIARVSLSDGTWRNAVELTAGVASLEPAVHTQEVDPARPLVGLKGLDDMTSTPDGTLYVVANGMGELLRVDPVARTACLVAGGLQNPSSVRIAPEGGGFADGDPATLDLYVTEFSGAIRLVRYRAA